MHLLDTNVVSELRRRDPDGAVLAWYAAADPESLFLSVLVIGEIRQGVERLRRRDSDRSALLDAWLEGLRGSFADRVLAITEPVAEAWGRLRVGAPLPVIDSLQAATALVHGFVVVSRDTKTAERVGVPWLDPWTGRRG